MRDVANAILLASIALAFGCSSPVESYCDKAVNCELFGENDTVEKCIAAIDKQVTEFREKDCDELADLMEAMFDCAGNLSCDELSESETSKKKCLKEVEAFDKADRNRPRQCERPVD